MSLSKTPADLVITPRNLTFSTGEKHQRWWHGGDPVPTTFYNAMSLTFPLGEAFFIESVRHYRNDVPEKLKAEIAAFVRQEGVHSREHVEFNRLVEDAGYDISPIMTRLRERLQWRRAQAQPHVSLAVTAALEHFTAILAHAWLKDGRDFVGAPKDIERLWRWHAIEEVEHKAVAYDTFLHVTRNISGFKRWWFRSRVMVLVTLNFFMQRIADMKVLFAQDGIDDAKTWRRVAGFMLFKPGLITRIVPAWLAWFKPGFHPWDLDDRHLLEKAERELGIQALPQAA